MKALLLAGAGALLLMGGLLTIGCSGPQRMHGCGSPEKKAEWVVKKISKELKLNEGQKATLTAIKDDLIKKHKELKPDQTVFHDKVKALLLSDNINADQVKRLMDEKRESHAAMKDYLISKIIEFHAILTPEQKQLLVDKLEKCQSQFNKWHHNN